MAEKHETKSHLGDALRAIAEDQELFAGLGYGDADPTPEQVAVTVFERMSAKLLRDVAAVIEALQ